MNINHDSQHEPVKTHTDLSVNMVRECLDDIPKYELASGYRIRWYESGDEDHWLRIHRESEGYGELKPSLFFDQYGRDVEALSRRVAFVCRPDGLPVATNTAWMNDWNGMHWGRIHWVATSRSEQGKGHSRPLMTAVCDRLSELGHDCAYLTTNTLRVRAIALYAAFGFKAYWESPEEQVAWDSLAKQLAEIGKSLEIFRG